jgi:hypothetical protein
MAWAELVRREDLVASHHVGDLGDLAERYQSEGVLEVGDGLALSPCRLGEEGSPHRLDDCAEDGLDRTRVVVDHGLLVGRTVHDRVRDTELAVQHVGQELDLVHQLVVNGAVELSDLLSAIGIRDTVLAFLQLELDVLTPLFGLCPSGLRLDDVGKLE